MDKNLHNEDNIIFCGDWNVAPEPGDVALPEFYPETIACSIKEREALKNVIDWGIKDSFRIHQKNGGYYSYWDYRGGSFNVNMGYRLDHIYITKSLIPSCVTSSIDIEPRTWPLPSDHTPVLTTLNIDKIDN